MVYAYLIVFCMCLFDVVTTDIFKKVALHVGFVFLAICSAYLNYLLSSRQELIEKSKDKSMQDSH